MALPPGPGAGGGLLDYLVRHRTASNLLLCLMLFGGIVAGTQIRAQFLPDIAFDDIVVTFNWPGAGPEDIDDGIIAVAEPSLIAIEGVEEAESSAREGTGSIELEFEAGWDMSRAMDDVKAAVDGLSDLPENAEEPTMRLRAWRDRVTDVVIYGHVGVDLLSRYADEFQSRLFEAGVTRTTIQGIADPVIRVSVPEAMLVRHDIELGEIADAVTAESRADPAGDLGAGLARVRTGTERRTAERVGEIAIRSLPDGSKLFLRDVASVDAEGVEEGEAYYRRGQPAVVVTVERSDQGDAIKAQKLVERVAAEMRPTLPEGVTLQLTRTRAEEITDRLDILLRNGALGLVLVLTFLFLFLSARTALFVAAGIPAAMAATIGLMYVSGLTLNMISLFALIICLGVVVDDAIVVGEHADFLARRRGLRPADAAASAARRMAAPVFSASITTVIAFASLAMIGGRFGELISDVPFTVSMVIIASLVESFFILPMHMRLALSAKVREPWYDWPSRTFNRGFTFVRERVIRRFTRLVVVLRYPAIAAAVMVLLVSGAAFFDGTVTWRFFNSPERGTISANIAMLPGATRADTKAMLDEMQRALDAVDERYAERHGTPPVVFSLGTVGGSVGRGLRSAQDKDRDLLGGFDIELIDPDHRPYTAFEFIGDWQAEIVNHPLLETLALRGDRSGPGGDAIDVKLVGASAGALKEAAEALKRQLAPLPGVSALEDTMAYDKAEFRLQLTPRGQALGFSTDQIGRELYNRLNGVEAAKFPVGTRSGTIRVGLPEDELTAAFLRDARMKTPAGGPDSYVPLSEIVTAETTLGFSSVRRENGQRLIRVTGDIAEDDPEAAELVMVALRDDILPGIASRFGVEWQLQGLAEQERNFLADARNGFLLCLLGIYLVLCWIFASWSRPMVVMAIIPFGLIGMIWGHWLHGIPISMFSIVGLIGMTGIIINNSIVLVTTVDEYARTQPILKALENGVADRLRPMVLTTATTVFGLAPLLFEKSRQAQFLLPTVITLAYGLGIGLFLVLVVTPALVAIQQDVAAALRSGRRLVKLAVGPRRQRRTAGPAE